MLETVSGSRSLRAPELEWRLSAGGRGQALVASQRGAFSLNEKNGDELNVAADHLELELASLARVQAISASGNVETRAARPGREPRTTHSQELRARFATDGGLTQAQQWGAFRAEAGGLKAEAGLADYDAASGALRLREQPVAWDATSRTSAEFLELRDQGNELLAKGAVRTVWQAAFTAGFGGSEPVQLTGETMRALPQQGWARYEGKARLWQGENRLAAEAIELFRTPQRLSAAGGVTAMFKTGGAREKQAQPIEIRAARFSYTATDRLGVFEGGVRATGEFGALLAPRLELKLAPGNAGLERAHASGGVRLEETNVPAGEAGWQATSEEAQYELEPPTVVLFGGTPMLFDPHRGTTRGARLTLNLADDTISIESAEGARTVTRRPWLQ
ncbi:MAG: hypothetical protein ACRESV_03055 [Nevskiales bacterium]